MIPTKDEIRSAALNILKQHYGSKDIASAMVLMFEAGVDWFLSQNSGKPIVSGCSCSDLAKKYCTNWNGITNSCDVEE